MVIVDVYNYMSTSMSRSHVFLVLSVGYLFYYLIEVVKVSSMKLICNHLHKKHIHVLLRDCSGFSGVVQESSIDHWGFG